jgi:glycogen synthase
MKSLFVASEVAGLAKAGGLGEVSAGLPFALRQRGIDVRVLMPAYHEVIAKLPNVNWFGDLPGRALPRQAGERGPRTGLRPHPSDGPLFGVVSRLVHQKGLNLVA